MYKDKGKQKEASRDRVRRYRALHKGVTSSVGVTSPVETKALHKEKGVTEILGNTRVIPNGRPRKMPEVTQKDIDGLPQVVKDGIGNVLESRRRLGLPDDTEERWVRAAQYNRLYGDYLAI